LRYCLVASKPASAKHLEGTLFEERTSFPGEHSPGTLEPVLKPRGGRKEAIPVSTPEMGKVAGAPPVVGQQSFHPPNRRGAIPHRRCVRLCVCVSVSVSVSVSVCLLMFLVPVLPPSVLLVLARVGSFGALASPFGVGLGAVAR
ncbi:hypothetical protein P4O66_021172, partial [Electrophorus voltai]